MKNILSKVPFVRSPYNYDRKYASDTAALVCPNDEDMAQQQFKDECDINTIMKRFGITGELPPGREGNYGDFSEVDDFASAMVAVREAGEAFMELPAKLRKRFNHDPGEFIRFIENNDNRGEAERLGLVAPLPPPAAIVKVEDKPAAAPTS